MTTTSSSDYLDYKKRKAIDADFFPDRNSSTYLTNKQYTTVLSTTYRNEDLICEMPKRFGVNITYDDALATHDTSLERKQLFIVPRKPISKYRKQKDENYMKYGNK